MLFFEIPLKLFQVPGIWSYTKVLVCVSFLFACFFSDRQLRGAWDGDRNLERKFFFIFSIVQRVISRPYVCYIP